MYDKIMGSLWVTSLGLILIPIGLYNGQNSKFIYWVLACHLMIDIIKDFGRSVINKLKEKIDEKETTN